MKARPILFSGPMMRAILEGRKTQTRRMIKLPTSKGEDRRGEWVASVVGGGGCFDKCGNPVPEEVCIWNDRVGTTLICSYGKPDDLLWIREEHYRYGYWEPVPGVKTKTGRQKWRFVAVDDVVRFDPPSEYRKGRHHKDPTTKAWHKRLARFMPKWASRLTLEIVDVRVERLQDISEGDALAEGCVKGKASGRVFNTMADLRIGSLLGAPQWKNCRDWYADLWEFINGPESWDANPWVWVIEFEAFQINVNHHQYLNKPARGDACGTITNNDNERR